MSKQTRKNRLAVWILCGLGVSGLVAQATLSILYWNDIAEFVQRRF